MCFPRRGGRRTCRNRLYGCPLPHRDIPGSLWLPDVGRGALSPELEGYFRDHLEAATARRHDMPVVFYCLADCWMSWNAAKRAASWSYTQVYWYR